MTSLYELTEQYFGIGEAIANGDFTDEEIRDTLEGLTGEYQDKLTNVARVIKNLEAEAEAIKAEKIRLGRRQAAKENAANRLYDYLRESISATGVNGNDPIVPVKLVKAGPKLIIDDEKSIPMEYWGEPMQKLDRVKLTRCAKAGPVPGVHMDNNQKRVKIG